MNLYQTLRLNYGQKVVKQLRVCDNLGKKIARFRNHRVFTLRCKDSNVTPSSLSLKCPINTNKARDIIHKAEKELLRERLRVVNNKLTDLNHKKDYADSDLKARGLPDNVQQSISQHLEKSREHEYKQVRDRQTRKYQRLLDKKEKCNLFKRSKNNGNNDNPDLSGTQLKRWVINLSKYKATDCQTRVLAKGLNFAVSPENVNQQSVVDEYIVACEKACWKLPTGEAAQLRSEIVGTLKSSKTPKANVSKEERTAIKQLQKVKSITILPADKGRATVILDSSDYENKLNALLSDSKTYTKLEKDPTTSYKRKLVAIISRLEK